MMSRSARTRRTTVVAGVLLAATASAQLATQSPPQPRPQANPPALAVIVHPDNRTRDLSLLELRQYFLLDRRKWDNRMQTVLYLRPSGSPEMKILLDRVYGKSAAALSRYWRNLVFQGKLTVRPSSVPSAKAAIESVKANPGAFTVILAEDVPATGVVVLKVGGKLPGEPGYELVGENAVGGRDGT